MAEFIKDQKSKALMIPRCRVTALPCPACPFELETIVLPALERINNDKGLPGDLLCLLHLTLAQESLPLFLQEKGTSCPGGAADALRPRSEVLGAFFSCSLSRAVSSVLASPASLQFQGQQPGSCRFCPCWEGAQGVQELQSSDHTSAGLGALCRFQAQDTILCQFLLFPL